MVLFTFTHISTVKMKNCSSETDTVQFLQCNFKTRLPLKVIQIQSFYKDIFKMSVYNKNERKNSYLSFSKQPNQTSLNKGGVRSSERFGGKSTINKTETYGHGIKCGTPRKDSSCNISEKLTDTSLKNKPATTHNEENVDSCGPSGSRVGSLTSSPKWSRIKDKFENVELNSKAKICRSSSLPRSDNESPQIKRDFSRASSRSLTSLSFENNLSTAKTSVITKLPTYKKCAIGDRRECAVQRISNKSISSNDSPMNSAHEAIKSQTKKLPGSVKIYENENKATITKVRRANPTPFSARSAASALLLASSRTNNTVSKTSHGLRESNSVVPKKIPTEKSLIGCAPKLLPKSSAKGNNLLTTNKNIRTPFKNSINIKSDHESSIKKGLDKSEQESITKNGLDENEQENLANKVLDKNELGSVTKKNVIKNEHESTARKGLNKFEPFPAASSHMNYDLKIFPENFLHMKSETDKIDYEIDKSNLMPVKGSDLRGLDFTGIKDQPVDKISTSPLASQMNKSNKSIWVKDSVGSWKKAPASVATSHQHFKSPSKVAQLRSKFNSSADEKSTQNISDLSIGKQNFLLKSSTTSCVPVKINDIIYDANLCNRQMSKSITTNSIFSTVNPSQLVGHDDQSIAVRNVVSRVGENKLNKKNNISSVSASQSNDNSPLVLENSLSSSEGSSPDSSHKLSLVQRAILSYEGNLSLLSPETQRKLRLLGGRVQAETDDDKLLVAKAKNDMLTVNAIKNTTDSNHSSSQVEVSKTDVIGNQQNISSQEERVGKPIRNFLCRYQNTNKKAKENKTTNMPCEVELNTMQRSDGIPRKYEFTPIPLVPSFHRSENGTSEVKCIGRDSIDILGAKNDAKTSNSIFYIDNPDEKSLYANYKSNSSNISQKQKQLSQVPISNEKIDQTLRPNASFLWRDTSIELNNETTVKSVSPKVRMESKEDNYYDLENYYSLIDNPDEAQFRSNEENSKCSDTEQCSHYAFVSKSMSQPERNLKSQSSECENKGLLDVDDGWTDLSDQDIYSQEAGSKTNLLSNTLRRKRNKKYGNRKSHLRRSWSQSLRDVTNASYYEKDCWSKEECKYGTCTESSMHEKESDSDADDGDHFYEPVYESLTNYLTSKKADECHSVGESPECESSKVFIKSSHTSVELTDKLPASDTCSETASEVQTDCSETSAGISKRAGDKIRQLKRHLSWTKNDFKLELSSKFNKIKIQKDLHNGTEIGVRVHEDNTLDNPKKKTFIKCILKQKHANAAVKRIPSPKKENSLFYVHLSLSREKQRPFSDSCVGERVPPENAKKENGLQKSRKKSEPSLSFTHSDNTAQQPARQLRKGSSGTIIQRPKTPPPLPPTNHVPKKSGKTNSPDIHETDSSIFKTLDKGMSLDSAYRSNSSNDSDSISFDNSFINFNVKETSEVPDTNSGHRITEELDANTEEKEDPEEDLEFRFENKDSLTSLSSIIDCFSTSILFSQRTRGSLASSASGDSYAPADESGSSGGASSTVYSSGITPPASEADIGEYSDRCTSFTSDFNLTLFSDFKNELLKSPFEEEPMYQFYHKDVQQRATLWYTADGSESEFEDDIINKSIEKDVVPASKPPVLHSQLSAMELIHGEGGQRTLWCEVPEVRNSGILENISAQDRKIQEAMFEVITSEASYLKSLNFLIEHFVQCPEFSGEYADKHILDKRERHILFSDISPVRDVSARLLADLEKRWLENIVLSNVCDIIRHHANQYFSVYVKYCSNQLYQDRTLKELKENRPEFVEVLKKLESSPVCQGLDMQSFLMLPMQRITRLPLLVDAIFHRLPVDSPIYEICKMSLAVLNKIVAECNEGARNMQRMEEMLVISRQLDFRKCKGLGLLSASRWLVKKGELIRLLLETTNRRTFVRNNWCKVHLYLFLFTDVLVVTRKKSDETYCVVDYCPRNMVQVIPVDENKFPSNARRPSSYRNLFQMTMLHNQDGKMVEMLLSCPLESDRTRWMDAVTPAISENPDEKIYEEWDCPQVQCSHLYIAQQPDELSLEETDVVNVFRKMADGWYEGERIRDGVRGWFPSSHTVEIVSSHVRARNLRQRYRLLMLSQTYLEEQQKAHAAAHGKGK